MNKNVFLSLGLFTLVGFGLLGIFIIQVFIEQPFVSLFYHGIAWHYQLLTGIIYGSFTAYIGWKIISIPKLASIKNFYSETIAFFELSVSDIIFISLCAGIGEEILFRGAAQYYLGIPLTSIIFVAIHGYLNPKDWKISIYGLYMLLVIFGIGYAFEYLGMIFCMTAHFSIDFVLLMYLTEKVSK